MMRTGRFWRHSLAAIALLLGAGGATAEASLRTEEDLPALIEAHGPRLERLLGELDLASTELSEVQRAVEAGERTTALASLLAHYRERPKPSEAWLPPFMIDPQLAVARANDVLADRFLLQGTRARQPRHDDGGLDWEATGPNNDPEWSWMLNRHPYFEWLLVAYHETGDARYIERLSADLVDWITTNPYPDRLTFSAAWRPLEVARRILNSWTHIFFALQDEPAFSTEARLLLLSSLPQHADALADHYSFWGGNHLLTETTALATIAVAWPEFAAADDWLTSAIHRFHSQLAAQTYPDGAFKELTNHYQKVVWLGAERFSALLAAPEAHAPAAEEDLNTRLEAMRRYFEGVMRPDGRGPLNNAADLEDNAWQLEHAGVDRRFPTTRLEGGGASPVLYFPWAGHAVMRDRWEGGQEWAFFDMGPFGSAHQHRDALHLSIWFGNRLFLADSGRYTYQPGPWASYFKGPRAHNVLLLDGSPPLPGPRTVTEPLANRVSIAEDHSSFAGRAVFAPSSSRGTSPAQHERTAVYLPGSGWLVIDEVKSFGAHTVETIWNFGPAVSRDAAAAHLRLIAARDRRGPLAPATDRYAQGQTDPVAGWYSEQFGEKQPTLAQHTTFRVHGRAFFIWAIPVSAQASVTENSLGPSRHAVTFFTKGGAPERTVELRFTPDGVQVDVRKPSPGAPQRD